MTKLDRAMEFIRANRYMGTKAIAKSLGMSKRTVRRAKAMVRGIDPNKAPKILLFDIETAPMEVYVWGLYKQRINPDNVIKDWSILTWSAKWLFEPNVITSCATTGEATARDDKRVVEQMWEMFDEADFLVAHNAWSFDVRKMNTRFLFHGMTPPLPYQVIDTYKLARKTFNMSSYKLDYMNNFLGLGRKIKTDFDLWKRCVTGDATALEEMLTYNVQDVIALEELYLELRPWMKSHPNMGLYMDMDKPRCSNCGSTQLDWVGTYYTPAGRFASCRCECGAIGRSRYASLTKANRKNLIVGTAR